MVTWIKTWVLRENFTPTALIKAVLSGKSPQLSGVKTLAVLLVEDHQDK